MMTTCPHGDPTCPCPDFVEGRYDPCHYEGADAMECPTIPNMTAIGAWAHCHVEGCSWRASVRGGRTIGECGLIKLGLPPAMVTPDGERVWSMTQARPGLIGWACGWLRTPLNVGWREVPE